MHISSVETFLVEVPLKWPIAPYQTRYAPLSTTSALLVRLETTEGIVGWGEAPQDLLGKPFDGGEAEQLRPLVLGKDPIAIEAGTNYYAFHLDFSMSQAPGCSGCEGTRRHYCVCDLGGPRFYRWA